MTPSKKFLKIVLITGISIYVLWRPVLNMLEIPVWGPGWAMGEWLAKRNLPISYCMWVKNPWWGIFVGPTTSEHKNMCITQYVDSHPNTEECSKLPARYSLTCLSKIKQKIFTGIRCLKYDGEVGLYCEGTPSAILVSKKAQIENCSSYKKVEAIEWCHFMRSSLLANVNECNEMRSVDALDECNMEYAFKMKDISLCKVIDDTNRKKYCELKIDLWMNNPKLRESDFFTGVQKSLGQ